MYTNCEAMRLFKTVIFPKRPKSAKFPASQNQLSFFFYFIFVVQRYSYIGVC